MLTQETAAAALAAHEALERPGGSDDVQDRVLRAVGGCIKATGFASGEHRQLVTFQIDAALFDAVMEAKLDGRCVGCACRTTAAVGDPFLGAEIGTLFGIAVDGL
jgi:hypothetical protein